MHLILGKDTNSMYLRLLADYLHLFDSFGLKIIEADQALIDSGIMKAKVPSFVNEDGECYSSCKVISRKFASLVNLQYVLCGEDDQQIANIEKYFDMFSHEKIDIIKVPLFHPHF